MFILLDFIIFNKTLIPIIGHQTTIPPVDESSQQDEKRIIIISYSFGYQSIYQMSKSKDTNFKNAVGLRWIDFFFNFEKNNKLSLL